MHQNKETGAPVTTNVLVRDLDLPVPEAADNRRLEVVADGLPIIGGSQLALDTTLVCALSERAGPDSGVCSTDIVSFHFSSAKTKKYS